MIRQCYLLILTLVLSTATHGVNIALHTTNQAKNKRVLAYEMDGIIFASIPTHTRKVLRIGTGNASAVAYSGSRVAYLRMGNIWIADLPEGRMRQITFDRQSNRSPWVFTPLRIDWHRSDRWILYTKVVPFIYDASKMKLIPAGRVINGNRVDLCTIWITDVITHKSRQVIGPMGNLSAFSKAGMLQFASCYEPMFSPDGKKIWFLHSGSLYEVPFDLKQMRIEGSTRCVISLAVLDLACGRSSHWSVGAQRLAWDGKHGRLLWWKGRFQGTGESEYGYITWRMGVWGPAVKPWIPQFNSQLKKTFLSTNMKWCAFDSQGYLWVYAYLESSKHWRWVRQDAKASLPIDAEWPDWQSN